jgi:uncharacterized protein
MTYPTCIAFHGDQRIAEGGIRDVARQIKLAASESTEPAILIFDAETSQPVEIDLRGSLDDVLARLSEPSAPQPVAPEQPGESPSGGAARGPGRPKLGVVAREITLLPRHWEWLALQPGGASVAIRKLVEDARKALGSRDRVRKAQEAAYRFASAMAGNRPNYEDAMRALFANDRPRFEAMTQAWPKDIRDHAWRLSAPAFNEGTAVTS